MKSSYCHNKSSFPLDKIVPTVGLNVGKIITQGVKITLWDMGGQDALRTLWKDYFLSCHGIVYVVDSEDEDRLLDSRDVFLKVISHVQTADLPLLVFANKRDSDRAGDLKRIKGIFKECADVIGQRDCVVLPCSALKAEGLEDGVEWITLRMKSNESDRPSRENG